MGMVDDAAITGVTYGGLERCAGRRHDVTVGDMILVSIDDLNAVVGW
jgi:hypothetical protein